MTRQTSNFGGDLYVGGQGTGTLTFTGTSSYTGPTAVRCS
jgi:hypothetical protein